MQNETAVGDRPGGTSQDNSCPRRGIAVGQLWRDNVMICAVPGATVTVDVVPCTSTGV